MREMIKSEIDIFEDFIISQGDRVEKLIPVTTKYFDTLCVESRILSFPLSLMHRDDNDDDSRFLYSSTTKRQ